MTPDQTPRVPGTPEADFTTNMRALRGAYPRAPWARELAGLGHLPDDVTLYITFSPPAHGPSRTALMRRSAVLRVQLETLRRAAEDAVPSCTEYPEKDRLQAVLDTLDDDAALDSSDAPDPDPQAERERLRNSVLLGQERRRQPRPPDAEPPDAPTLSEAQRSARERPERKLPPPLDSDGPYDPDLSDLRPCEPLVAQEIRPGLTAEPFAVTGYSNAEALVAGVLSAAPPFADQHPSECLGLARTVLQALRAYDTSGAPTPAETSTGAAYRTVRDEHGTLGAILYLYRLAERDGQGTELRRAVLHRLGVDLTALSQTYDEYARRRDAFLRSPDSDPEDVAAFGTALVMAKEAVLMAVHDLVHPRPAPERPGPSDAPGVETPDDAA
jgi:hypothetical protein